MRASTAFFAKTATPAILACYVLTASSALAGKKSFVEGEYWQRAPVAKARSDQYEVGIAVPCNGSYTIEWVKVQVKLGGSGDSRKTYDTFNKNLGCPEFQTQKFYLMEYTFDELIEFVGGSETDTANIRVQLKGLGGGKDGWEHLSVYRTRAATS